MHDISRLPNELLHIVFTNLGSHEDWSACSLVCRGWYAIVTSCQWKHISFAFTDWSEESIRNHRTCSGSFWSHSGRVKSCSMIWKFFEAQENRDLANLVRNLNLSPHLGVHRKKAAKVPPADILRIFACFPNLRKVTLTDVDWVSPRNCDWINLTPPALEELRIDFKLYGTQFRRQKLDLLLSPLGLFTNVKCITISGFTASPIAEVAETAVRQVACNPESLCIRGFEIAELLLGILLLLRNSYHISRLRSLEIGKLSWANRLSLTISLSGELLRQVGHQLRHLTLHIDYGATNEDYTSLLSHCPNLTDLVICVETDVESMRHDDHGNRLVLEQSFLRDIHMCSQLHVVYFLVRIAAPIPGDDIEFCCEDYMDCGHISEPDKSEAFSSLACATCKVDRDFQKQLEDFEDILLGVESLTTVAFAFYQETGVDNRVAIPTFRTTEEMAKTQTIFPRLYNKGMLKAIQDEALDWDELPDSAGHLHPRPRLSLTG